MPNGVDAKGGEGGGGEGGGGAAASLDGSPLTARLISPLAAAFNPLARTHSVPQMEEEGASLPIHTANSNARATTGGASRSSMRRWLPAPLVVHRAPPARVPEPSPIVLDRPPVACDISAAPNGGGVSIQVSLGRHRAANGQESTELL